MDYEQIIIIIAIAIIAFFLLRELFCWYYKINERLKEQKKTNRLLEQILENNTKLE